METLAEKIKTWAKELGFTHIGITDTDVGAHTEHLQQYLDQNHQGTMDFMLQYNEKRRNPENLVPTTKSIIVCALNYLPESRHNEHISYFVSGRDYHKVMKQKLQKLAKKISVEHGDFNYRCFVDSAPVLEKALALKAGIGWQGKNSLILNQHGSRFILGEIFTDLDLPADKPLKDLCGNCSKCMDSCPTKAIIAPHKIDARRCIAYLTIEHKGSIPEDLRPLMGTQIYGCDICQNACPWNKDAEPTKEADFQPRQNIDSATLTDLFSWSEEEYLKNTEGSAIRRLGYERWLRNIAVALGNYKDAKTPEIIKALKARQNYPSQLVQEHVAWALKQHLLI